jgi:hypothetical protein
MAWEAVEVSLHAFLTLAALSPAKEQAVNILWETRDTVRNRRIFNPAGKWIRDVQFISWSLSALRMLVQIKMLFCLFLHVFPRCRGKCIVECGNVYLWFCFSSFKFMLRIYDVLSEICCLFFCAKEDAELNVETFTCDLLLNSFNISVKKLFLLLFKELVLCMGKLHLHY